jgi:predicted PurR-regulated permease PerM
MDGWMGQTGFGLGYDLSHWLMFAIIVAVVLYPLGRILNRVGYSPFWSVLALFPFVNLLALWVLAFSDWPREGEKRT